MKKRRTSQGLIVVVVVAAFVVVAALGYFVLISPKRSEAKKLDEQIAQTQQEIQDNLAAAAHAKHVQPIRVADLFRLTKAMPDRADMAGIVLQLSDVARHTGITFQSITPEASQVVGAYQVVPIDLVFEGNFYDLADFLYRLRNLVDVRQGQLEATGRLFAVESVDFAEGENKFPQILATLTVDAFVYGSSTPATSAAPTTAGSTTTTSTDTTSTSTATTESTTTSTTPEAPPPLPGSASAAGATG